MTNKVDTREINYDVMAPAYDERRFTGAQNAYCERVRKRAMLEGIGLRDFDRAVLDVGSGTFRGLLALQEAGFTNLRGLELSSGMIARGRSKLTRRVPIDRGSAFQLPYAASSFDVVVSWNFLHMFRLDLQRELIAEMARVCRPGGLVVAELESLHKGLFVTRLLEQRKHRRTTKYTALWEVRQLFPAPTFADVRVRGSLFPKLYKMFYRMPSIGERIEQIAFVPPFNWMAARVAIAAIKVR